MSLNWILSLMAGRLLGAWQKSLGIYWYYYVYLLFIGLNVQRQPKYDPMKPLITLKKAEITWIRLGELASILVQWFLTVDSETSTGE